MQKNLWSMLLAGVVCAGSTGIARAEVPAVSFEYKGSTRIDGSAAPMAKFKVYANLEKGRMRKLVKYVLDVPEAHVPAKMAQRHPMGANFLSHFSGYNAGGIGYIIDREDDQLIVYSDAQKSYIQQPRMELLKQLRFDPFAKVAPELSKTAPPELTPEQRQRLGREMNLTAHAFLKNNVKIYFHPLLKDGKPIVRHFDGLEDTPTHGYRMTVLFNTSKPGGTPHWGRIASEWWIAEELPGDDLVRSFTGEVINDWENIGGFSTSMWLNEALPVLWEALPREFKSAVATYMPMPPSDKAWYSGTLAYLAITTDMTNTTSPHRAVIRTEITLKDRNTAALQDSVFQAPAAYTKQDIGFLLMAYQMMSASLLDGTIAQMMGEHKIPLHAPLHAGMPMMTPLLPVLNSGFAANLQSAGF